MQTLPLGQQRERAFLLNVGTCLPKQTVKHPRGKPSSYSFHENLKSYWTVLFFSNAYTLSVSWVCPILWACSVLHFIMFTHISFVFTKVLWILIASNFVCYSIIVTLFLPVTVKVTNSVLCFGVWIRTFILIFSHCFNYKGLIVAIDHIASFSYFWIFLFELIKLAKNPLTKCLVAIILF